MIKQFSSEQATRAEGWRGELASVLCGVLACTRHPVEGVVIDHLPEVVDGGLLTDLVKVDREAFVGRLLAGRRQPGRSREVLPLSGGGFSVLG